MNGRLILQHGMNVTHQEIVQLQAKTHAERMNKNVEDFVIKRFCSLHGLSEHQFWGRHVPYSVEKAEKTFPFVSLLWLFCAMVVGIHAVEVSQYAVFTRSLLAIIGVLVAYAASWSLSRHSGIKHSELQDMAVDAIGKLDD